MSRRKPVEVLRLRAASWAADETRLLLRTAHRASRVAGWFRLRVPRSESYDEWSAREGHDDCGSRDDRGPILVASLKFWRATTTDDNPLGVATLFEVARRAFPKVQTPAERPQLSAERTVVEMAVPLMTDETNPLTCAFESGVDCLRTFQRAYHLTADKPPLTLASRERMPVAIPLALRDTDEQDSWPSELRPFMLNTNIHADTRLPDLTASQLEVLGGSRRRRRRTSPLLRLHRRSERGQTRPRSRRRLPGSGAVRIDGGRGVA